MFLFYFIARKKKQELIHKARVKSEYYKTLEKEHADNTPDYVKEVNIYIELIYFMFILIYLLPFFFNQKIFEKTIDQDGNIVEYEPRSNKRSSDKESSDTENNDSLQKTKKRKKDDDTTKS